MHTHFFCPGYFMKLIITDELVVFLNNFTWKIFHNLLSFRETQDFSNRKYPWLKKSIFLLILLCAFILAGVVILALYFGQYTQSNNSDKNESQQELDSSSKVDQSTQSNSRDKTLFHRKK